mgnify:CR=1 FL=1
MAITDLEMADLVREVCYDMGAGPLILGGPLSGYRAFADAVSEGAQFPYMIVGIADPAQWEAGTGALDGSGRLVRTPVASSSDGAAVDFGAGEKRVGLALHSGWAAAVEAHGHGIAGVAGLGAALAGKQEAHANLTAIAGQASAADQLSYWTGAGTAGMTGLGALGRGLIDAADATAARGVLGLGAMATQQPGAVAISGGVVSGITDLAVADGGTGASSAAAARANLGAGTVTSIGAGNGMSFATITGAGSVTLGTPGSVTLSSGNGVTADSHSHGFAPGGTSAQYIRGDGTLATLPTVTPAALTKSDDANVTLTLGGAASVSMLAATSITVGWTGQLSVPRGGTGAADLTGYVKGNGTSAMTASATIPGADVSGNIAGNAANVTGTVALANGGTGATSAAAARTALGLGTIATQAASAVSLTGGSIAGLSSLGVSTAAAPAQITIDSGAGQLGTTRLYSGGSTRWLYGKQNAAESGSNAGSNFILSRYDDAGVALGTAITVNRATGIATLEGLSTVNATITGGAITGVTSLSAHRNGASSAMTVALSADAGFSTGVNFQTGSVNRWAFGKSTTAEAGANAGADFVVTRYSDAGGSLGAAISIVRSTGEMSIGGNLLPTSDNARTLGSSSFRWSTVYAGSGTINTSDARLKRDIGEVGDGLLDAWSEVSWSRYRFIDAWEAKGEGARWHIGLIAQQVRDAIDARLGEGAAVTLGLVCHDRWDALDEERDEDGHVTRPGRAEGDRWGLRYEECLAVEAAWQRRRMARIEARLDALEARDVAG